VNPPVINFDKKTYHKLKRRYGEAKKRGDREFHFENTKLATDYAYYILEFLRPQFEKKKRPRLED
jgi:hypothetical protein